MFKKLFLLCSMLVLGQAALFAQSAGIAWSLDGVGGRLVDWRDLENHVIRVQLPTADVSSIPVSLQCSNAETGETGSVILPALMHDSSGAMQVMLTPLLGLLPYPTDPGAMQSKALAITTQRSGMSPFRMTPAQMRAEFNTTLAYMLTTANHHYPLPLGDGRLDCEFTAEGIPTSGSAAMSIVFGRGLPEGLYLRETAVPDDISAWRTWVVTDAPTVSSPNPINTEAVQGALSPEQMNAVRRWDDGSAVTPWMDVTLDALIANFANPVRASRALSLVSVSMYDALVLAAQGSAHPPEGAIVAEAASAVLAYLFPADADYFAALRDEALQAAVWAGDYSDAQIVDGRALGHYVAEQVIARAQADGSDAVWDGIFPEGVHWQPTPPDYARSPLEPLAGTWRVWNIPSAEALRPLLPSQDDAAYRVEMQTVYEVGQALTLEQEQIASYWEDKKGTFTPPGHWNRTAAQMIREVGLSSYDAALIFATLNTAQADAFIVAWNTKYTYWTERPVTAIRAALDPDWWPYIITPAFPSFISGHATTSGAASTVLSSFFPLRHDVLTEWAEEAARSRLYGGIHFPMDNIVGLQVGAEIGEAALMRVRQFTEPDTLGSGS